jgi:anti-sigma regulatory factor (Ser/Thr protein kinase)
VIGSSELRIACPADLSLVGSLRHALASFLEVFGLDRELIEDIVLASGEVLANAVEHGSASVDNGRVELLARSVGDGTLAVEIRDSGRFIERDRVAGRGFGLGIVRHIARSVEIDVREGTCVRMIFDPQAIP